MFYFFGGNGASIFHNHGMDWSEFNYQSQRYHLYCSLIPEDLESARNFIDHKILKSFNIITLVSIMTIMVNFIARGLILMLMSYQNSISESDELFFLFERCNSIFNLLF